MKKVMFIFIACMLFAAIHKADAQSSMSYPIPSYDVMVNGLANFQESNETGSGNTDGKKTVKVVTPCYNTPAPCEISISVYSLDGLYCLGPYLITSGQSFSIEVDDRAWGVNVQTECAVEVDVFISQEGL